MTQVVYVSGELGKTPDYVCTSLEAAIASVLRLYTSSEADPLDVRWTCVFVNGEATRFRCNTVVQDGDGRYELYAERYEIDEADVGFGPRWERSHP